ncbi:MAG: hypothetical protein AAB592_03895 [Patescibacteria group bacterium]
MLFLGLAVIALLLVNFVGAPHALALEAIRPEDDPVRDITGGQSSIRSLALLIVNFFLGFLGLLAVIMIIYGGFIYVSSAGEQEKVDEAKKILTYAVIGIVVIVISFALVNTLLGGLGAGTDVGGTP